MSIPRVVKRNFNTLQRAATNGDMALMECTDIKTREPRYAICAVHKDPDGMYTFTPFALMIPGNPYDQLDPPT